MLLSLALHPSCYSSSAAAAAAAAAASSSSPLFVRPRFRPAASPNAHHLLPSSSPPLASRTEANSPFHQLRRSCVDAPSRPSGLRFCPRSASRPSPPPPPPGEDRNYIDGMQTTLTRIQDRLRIFFAVLFWMSLFFWASIYDGKNDAKKKGPWFRK
ncbi:pectinesterase inhibitor 10-like [Zingiber officinale]|uniref:pectinesterase inhibitor 10-like n=1 Tax=Zingiber officinale TaxID=94328 RepID=UPI001C4D6C77|nr:pectinesterase inhibitor 10-like [Zingiber officinale]